MAPIPGAADRSGRRFPDRVVIVLGTDERVCNLVKNRVPDLFNRCFEAKEARHADHPDAVSTASSLSRSVVELKTPTYQAVSTDESFRYLGDCRQALPVSPSGIACNRFKQCVWHPIVLAVGASDQGALGAEPGDDASELVGFMRERNLVFGAEACLERVNTQVNGLFLPILIPRQQAPWDSVFASVCRYDQCAPDCFPRNMPPNALAMVGEADGVAEGELGACRHVFNQWVRSRRAGNNVARNSTALDSPNEKRLLRLTSTFLKPRGDSASVAAAGCEYRR